MKIANSYKKINKMIDSASSVYVMGHKDLDLDALGACLGIYQYASNFGKMTYFVLDDVKLEAAVSKVINESMTEINFITSNKLKNIKNSDSLLIVVDTNKNYLLQSENANDLFSQKIVIDHHNIGKSTIENAELIIDTDASSTCEMITEFLKLNKYVIDSNLATILLAGIVLDTNNYTLKTDSNTFYYSYYLTSCGANPNKVQYLLKQDLKKYIKRQKMITNVKIVNNIAITKGVSTEIYRKEDLAKTADSLLLFNEIEASFVIGMLGKNKIGISARSMGNINVGQVLSMFNGGGDANFAAAVLENTTLNKVEQELLNVLKLL